MSLHRRTLLAAAALPAILRAGTARAADPIVAGVSGPLTGPNAQYGAQWKRGFDLALEQINGAGGAKGRPIQYLFEDSQSDPRQSVGIAQKFVADPRIIMELGDFSSPASMAASPVYQRGKLVQFGFTNSHPDFTKGGDYMWSTSPSQGDEQPQLADFVIRKLGFSRPAVLYLNTDWGRTSRDVFVKAAKELGVDVPVSEGYMPTEQDFRPTLLRARDARPDCLVLLSYYADAALIARQVRDTGIKQTLVAGTSIYSPKMIELGGPAANGVYSFSTFFPDEPRPEVQDYVRAYKAKYDLEPDTFSAGAYDVMLLVHALCEQFPPTRQGIHDGLGKIRDVPSVIYGRIAFNPETRRVPAAAYKFMQIKDGKFTLWDGTKPARSEG